MKNIFAAALTLILLVSCGESGSTGQAEGEMPKLEGEVSFTLEDGEERNRENPSTFWIADKSRRENLKEGQIVKLMFDLSNGAESQTERMWVVVKKRNEAGSGYIGVLDNDPVSTTKIKAGLEVEFEPRHVIDIYEEPAKDADVDPIEVQ